MRKSLALHDLVNQPSIVQVVELMPEKKVVWALREWKESDLGPASCIQLLDDAGRDQEMELMR